MKAGFVGKLEHFPDGYQCYIIFLPNETNLTLPVEDIVIENFLQIAISTDDDVLFSGVTSGPFVPEARQRLGIDNPNEPYFVILDKHPVTWDKDRDPIVKIPLGNLEKRSDVIKLMITLVTVSSEKKFISTLKTKVFFERAKEILAAIPIGDLITVLIPS